MTEVIVTVHQPSARAAVMLDLSIYGEVQPYEHLKRAFMIEVAEEFEADFMLTVANDARVSGTSFSTDTVAPVAFKEEFIFEGRVFNEKIGALRLKATQDTDSGVFNPWWRQPDFFKWRYDTDRLGAGTIIAIVDGGIRWGHPEFAKNPGRVTRIHNYATNSNQGASNHGTACAALAAGDRIGIAPEAELWDVKTFPDDGGSATNAWIIAGLNALLGAAKSPVLNPQGKVVIANLSFGAAALNLANPYGSIIDDLQAAGVIVLIAAGNDSSDLDTTFNAWPAESSEYAVGAIHYDGRRAAFSNYGSRVKLYGFGHKVMGAGYPQGNEYGDINGTSFACPYVCGCLATWMPGRWVPQNDEQVRTVMNDFMAFCSEGIYGSGVRVHDSDALVPGAVIGRASYFPVLPGDVIVPQINAVAKFGTGERGVLAWKSRVTPVVGGANYGVTGVRKGAAILFEGPFEWTQGGPWMDPLYVPVGWAIENDRVRNRSGLSGAGMFTVTTPQLAAREYWEIDVKGPAAGMVVGVTKATNRANYDEPTTGMGAAGVAWGADGSLVADGVAQTATITYTQGDRLMLAYDTATGGFWCGKNGVWAATPGTNAALAVSAVGASRAAFSVPDGSALQLYGTSNHQQYSVTGFTGFNLGEAVEWALDPTYVKGGHLLDENNTRLVNVSGGSNYLWWLPTVKRIQASQIGRVYWEVQMQAGATNYDGYVGLVTPTAITNHLSSQVNPLENGSTGYRGGGAIWASTTGAPSSQRTGLASFGNGKRAMFLFEPSTGQWWVGVNGVWDRDPSGIPSHTVYQVGIPEWGIALQGRNLNDGQKLISMPADFAYPIPAGAMALASLP